MALLTTADFPAGLVTQTVLTNLGGNSAIDAASRQAHDENFIVIGGKYVKSDSAVTASAAYKAILIKRTLVNLYVNNEVLRAQNAGLIEFFAKQVDDLLKAALKDGGAIEGLTLVSAEQAETLGGGGWFSSDTRIFGAEDY